MSKEERYPADPVLHDTPDDGADERALHAVVTSSTRLTALRRTALLDSPAEDLYDRMTRLAARILGAPISLISLVDDTRQFFKSAVGLPEPWASLRQTPLSHSFCKHVVGSGAPLLIENSRFHPLVRANGATTEIGVVAYAGVPLSTSDGETLGSFCVIDTSPRRWSDDEVAVLQELAAVLSAKIELRTATRVAVEAAAEAERERREKEEILDRVTDAFFALDDELRFTYVNRRAESFLGLDAAHLLGCRIWEVFPAAERTGFAQRVREVAAAGRAVQFEEPWYAAGSWFETHVYPSEDGLTVYLQDVTERVEVEAEAEHQRNLAKQVMNTVGEGLTVTDPDGRFLYVNPAYADLVGREVSEVVGLTPWDMTLAADHAILQDARARRQRGERTTYQARLAHRDGSAVPVSVTTAPRIVAGENVGAIAVVRDLRPELQMERRLVEVHAEATRAGATLRTVEDRYQRLIDSVEEYAIIELDRQGRVTTWHRGAERIHGYSDTEALGSPISLFFHPADLAMGEPERVLEEARRNGSARTEGVRLRKGGEPFFAEVQITALRDERGEVTGFAQITRDRSEWKRSQDALREADTQLRQMQKMDAIGRLAGTIVHDFNNILTVVRGQAEIALAELEPANPVWLDLKEIVKAAERGVALNQQLLSFSREAPLQATVIEPNAVIVEMRRMMERVLGEQVRLETQLDPRAGQIRIDRTQLEQVMMNLAANARDSMPGGGTFSVRTRRVELGEELARRQPGMSAGPYLLLTVSDSGFGMDAETQARCFEPFFTTKARGKGTGLGLATVYGVLRQNGGHVRLESVPGRGTTFRIYLPLAVREPVESEERPRQRIVLLVEDEESVRHIIRRILRREGYGVLEAADAGSAMRLAEEHAASIDAVVADRVVPGARPAELVAALEERLPGVGIIQISGYSDAECGIPDGAGSGGILLTKPFAPAELSNALRSLLGGVPPQPAAV